MVRKNLTGAIVGKVVSPRGNPLSGVKIEISGEEATTLADGTYRIEGLASSTYEVTAHINGYEPNLKVVTVGEVGNTTVDFSLREAVGTGTIEGLILDNTTKKAISSEGTVVLILPLGNKYASVDDKGHYRFVGLPPGSHELWASSSLYEDKRMTVTLREAERKIINFHCVPSNRVEPPWG